LYVINNQSLIKSGHHPATPQWPASQVVVYDQGHLVFSIR